MNIMCLTPGLDSWGLCWGGPCCGGYAGGVHAVQGE